MVMPILGAIGAASGPIASIAGGIGSLFGKSKRSKHDPYKAHKKALVWRAADAKTAGFHPLAGMGLGNTSPPYIPNEERDWQGAGEAVSKGLTRMFDKRSKRLLDAEIALKRAQVDTEYAKAMAISSEVNRATQGTPGIKSDNTDNSGVVIPGQTDSDINATNAIIPEKPAQSKPGLEHGLQGLFTMHRWPVENGPDMILYIPNQNASEYFTEGVGKGYAVYNEVAKRLGYRPPSPPRSFLRKDEFYMWNNKVGTWFVGTLKDFVKNQMIPRTKSEEPWLNRQLGRGKYMLHEIYQ